MAPKFYLIFDIETVYYTTSHKILRLKLQAYLTNGIDTHGICLCKRHVYELKSPYIYFFVNACSKWKSAFGGLILGGVIFDILSLK